VPNGRLGAAWLLVSTPPPLRNTMMSSRSCDRETAMSPSSVNASTSVNRVNVVVVEFQRHAD
jgi:hypothetical protein